MGRKTLAKIAQAHFAPHRPMLSVVFRSLCQVLALLGSLSQSDAQHEVVIYFAILCFCFEMAWAAESRIKLAWYMACILGLAVCGCVLVREAKIVQQTQEVSK